MIKGEKKSAEKFYQDKYDLNNPVHRDMVKEFEKQHKGRTITEILASLGYVKLGYNLTDSYVDGAFIEEIHDTKEKYKALGRLEGRRDYMRQQEIGFEKVLNATPKDKIGDIIVGLERFITRENPPKGSPSRLLLAKIKTKYEENKETPLDNQYGELLSKAGIRTSFV